jgi:hypothetical protein
MPNLDHTGPEGAGSQAGRGLGRCRKTSMMEKLLSLGKGMGKKRHSGGGAGKGKRLNTSQQKKK